MRSELSAFIRSLDEEVFFDEVESLNRFRHGGHWAICTDSALRVARQFKGTVWGYYAIENLQAAIGLSIAGGHDFAVIDSRWLVDYWACNVAQVIQTPIFDLNEDKDRDEVRRLYGPSRRWSMTFSPTNSA
jgi:hypothetical protein